MARKVVNITHTATSYDLLSQTPKNYDKRNYFLKELQDKIDAEWDYRPNRVDIEYEDQWGEQTFKPIEVVMQTVRSEKGVAISDDCRNIVFRDILERRFRIGSRYRFGDFPIEADTKDTDKDVWIAINTNSANLTSSMVIQRCNGTIGSLWLDSQGVSHRHYEPVIQGVDLTGVSVHYSEVALSPESQLLIIAQHNEYTKKYFVNQRFIIGYDKVYKIKAINKFYSNSTNDPENVGLMRIYLEVTESSPYDDFEHRIAHQVDDTIILHEDGGESPSGKADYRIVFELPEVIPTWIGADEVAFKPKLKNLSDNSFVDVPFTFEYNLMMLPAHVNPNIYITVHEEEGTYIVKRNRIYLLGDLILRWAIDADDSPTGEEISVSFEISLRHPDV